MKTVSFKCEESTTQLFVQILNKLANAGDKNQTRKIRIGGDEYTFMGGCDFVSDLSINNHLYSHMTPSEQRDIEILRAAIVAPAPTPTNIPTPANVPATSPIDNSVPDNSNDNDPTDDDSDILDSAEAISVRDVVVDKVGQNEMFTAFDITKALRQNGTQVVHRNIKQIVHALYNHGDMMGYDRSLINVGNAPVRPFLYHPVSADPLTYQA